MDNQALLDALEQARAALDEVEAAATQNRRDRLKNPAVPKAVAVEIETPDDEME